MGVMDGLGRLGDQFGRGTGSIFVVVEPIGQAAALDELHGEVLLPLVLADLVDRDDARVVELGDGLGLVLEPAELNVAGEDAGPDHLQGHLTIERHLASKVHDPHAAPA